MGIVGLSHMYIHTYIGMYIHFLREHRKEQYLATKAEYAAAIRKERYTSWKEYCTMTSITNPWSGIYKTLAGRDRRAAPQTTKKLKTKLRGFSPRANDTDRAAAAGRRS